MYNRREGNADYYKLLETSVKWSGRFYSKIDKCITSGCWNWLASKNSDGYGRFYVYRNEEGQTRIEYPHRLTYMLFNGEIPEGYSVDHICFNRSCCNPDHLQLLTIEENSKRHLNNSY